MGPTCQFHQISLAQSVQGVLRQACQSRLRASHVPRKRVSVFYGLAACRLRVQRRSDMFRLCSLPHTGKEGRAAATGLSQLAHRAGVSTRLLDRLLTKKVNNEAGLRLVSLFLFGRFDILSLQIEANVCEFPVPLLMRLRFCGPWTEAVALLFAGASWNTRRCTSTSSFCASFA